MRITQLNWIRLVVILRVMLQRQEIIGCITRSIREVFTPCIHEGSQQRQLKIRVACVCGIWNVRSLRLLHFQSQIYKTYFYNLIHGFFLLDEKKHRHTRTHTFPVLLVVRFHYKEYRECTNEFILFIYIYILCDTFFFITKSGQG